MTAIHCICDLLNAPSSFSVSLPVILHHLRHYFPIHSRVNTVLLQLELHVKMPKWWTVHKERAQNR